MKHCIIVCLLLFAPGCDQPVDFVLVPSATPTQNTMSEFEAFESRIICGKVIEIVEGDTLDILTEEGEMIRIRLHGVDSPELDQPFGIEAKELLSQQVLSKDVAAFPQKFPYDEDRYGRTIANVQYSRYSQYPYGRAFIGEDLVYCGLAWHYTKYAPDNEWLAKNQADAKKNNRGLWSDSGHIAPWVWRTLSRERRSELP